MLQCLLEICCVLPRPASPIPVPLQAFQSLIPPKPPSHQCWDGGMRGAFKSAAPCRRAKRNAKSCTESCKIPALIQSWCRVRTEPCKTRRVLTLLTSRRPRALRRRARNAVLVFDLFSDLLSGHPKSDFLKPSGIARILPDGQNFLRSPKKQEFSVEFCRFSRHSCGEAFQGRF